MKELPKQRISTTDLARNLANVIDQVRISRTRMTITKGSQEVAQLVPVAGNGTTLADLQALADEKPELSLEKPKPPAIRPCPQLNPPLLG